MKLSLNKKDYAEQIIRVINAYIDRSICKLIKDNKYDEFDKTL
jgi:hypothetical protein